MKILDRIYWLRNNLIRFPIVLLWMIIEFPINIIKLIYLVLFVTDGSEELCWPWEHMDE